MFNLEELSTLRSALNFISVKGSDVQRIAALQIKLENIIIDIQNGPPVEKGKNEKNSK